MSCEVQIHMFICTYKCLTVQSMMWLAGESRAAMHSLFLRQALCHPLSPDVLLEHHGTIFDTSWTTMTVSKILVVGTMYM